MKIIFMVVTSDMCNACRLLKAHVDNRPSMYSNILSWVTPFVDGVKEIVVPELNIPDRYEFLQPHVKKFPSFLLYVVDNQKHKTWYTSDLNTRSEHDFESWIDEVKQKHLKEKEEERQHKLDITADSFAYPVFNVEEKSKLKAEEYNDALSFFRRCVQTFHSQWQNKSKITFQTFTLPLRVSQETLQKVYEEEIRKINVPLVVEFTDKQMVLKYN